MIIDKNMRLTGRSAHKMWWQALIPIATSLMSNNRQKQGQQEANAANYESQREFAQMGLQWKAADAKAAGLHPMAALNSGQLGFSPSFQSTVPNTSDNGISDSLRSMGQNNKRAEVATMTPAEREMEALALERAKLQNRLLEGQVQNEWAALMGQPPTPPLPVGGSVGAPTTVSGRIKLAPAGKIQSVPSQSISSAPGDPGIEAAGTPGFKSFGVTESGLRAELPNQELAESLEGMGIAGHLLGPLLSAIRSGDKLLNGRDKPSNKLLPPNTHWHWSVKDQSWTVRPNRRPAVSGSIQGTYHAP